MNYKLVSTTLATMIILSGVCIALQDAPVSVAIAPPPAQEVAVPQVPSPAVAKPQATTTQTAKPTATTTQKGAAKSSVKTKPPKPVPPPKPAWQQFKLNKKTKMFLDFTDANPDMVLSMFARTSGITILRDPSFKVPLTVTSATSVGMDDAFEILNTVLNLNQYELQKRGKLMVVSKIQPAAPPAMPQPMPQPPQPAAEEKSVLKVYHLTYANASQVARVVNEVFSQQQLETLIQQLQQGGGMSMPNQFGGGNRGAQQPKVVRASSDDYANAVVVNAPEKLQTDVAGLVKELDKSSDTPLESELFKLTRVSVDEVVDAIQDVLTANAPTGRGAGKPQETNQNPYYSYYGMSSRSSKTNGQTAVVVRPSNSIIVSATKENMETVRKLIKSLDVESDFVGTTYVIKLENAKASEVATLLNSAFTKRKDQNEDNPFFIYYSDMYSDNSNKKSSITTDLTEDGKLVNVRDLTGKVNVMADPNTNSLIIVTLPSNMKLIQKVVDQIDRISDQVMIETVIVEANLDKTTKLGVEWNFLRGGHNAQSGSTDFGVESSDTTSTPLKGYKYTLTGPDYKVFLNALQTDTKFKVLSTPRIFTSNNVKAEINVSQQVPYITSQQTTNTTTGLISNYDFKNVGVVLTVTPRITAAGEVSMDVVQSADDLQGYTDYNAPIINHRQASTTASVKDGETIVLGGIIRSTHNLTENKIPFLGDLPIIGSLFRSTTRSTGQTELMVLLTPHIVRNSSDAQKLRADQTQQLSSGSRDSIKTHLGAKGPGGH